MTERKWTPWHVQTCEGPDGQPHYEVWDAAGDTIAEVGDLDVAHIFAAAPDLDDALERAEQLISGDLVGADWKRACHELVRDARAALKKARGETE